MLSSAQVMFACGVEDYEVSKQIDSSSSLMKQIQKQIADLQTQLVAIITSKKGATEKTKGTK